MATEKHWVTVIETDAPEVYNGVRIGVFHSEEEAKTDVREWLEDYLKEDEEEYPYTSIEELMNEYREYTGRAVKIEETDA